MVIAENVIYFEYDDIAIVSRFIETIRAIRNSDKAFVALEVVLNSGAKHILYRNHPISGEQAYLKLLLNAEVISNAEYQSAVKATNYRTYTINGADNDTDRNVGNIEATETPSTNQSD